MRIVQPIHKGDPAHDRSGNGIGYSLPGQPSALSQDLTAGAPSPGALSQELSPLSEELDPLSQEFERPLWSDWDEVPPETAQALLDLASPIHETRRADPEEIQKVILAVCRGHYLGIRIIAQLLQRDAQDLSRRHLKTLVEVGQLVRRYQRPNDPRQAYTAKDHP